METFKKLIGGAIIIAILIGGIGVLLTGGFLSNDVQHANTTAEFDNGTVTVSLQTLNDASKAEVYVYQDNTPTQVGTLTEDQTTVRIQGFTGGNERIVVRSVTNTEKRAIAIYKLSYSNGDPILQNSL